MRCEMLQKVDCKLLPEEVNPPHTPCTNPPFGEGGRGGIRVRNHTRDVGMSAGNESRPEVAASWTWNLPLSPHMTLYFP